jgi:GDP-L-fucose synthase
MKVFVAGHNGMVGSAICSELKNENTYDVLTKNRSDLDLLNQEDCLNFLKKEKPDIVIVAAAKVGGIKANSSLQSEFLFENLQIQNNLIYGSHLADINKVLFLGSSCIYPKFADQPITEEQLLSGYLEKTNEGYAIAKIAGLKLCEFLINQYKRDYRSLMPCNLYGPNDNFSLENSHVIPGLLRKFHIAKTKNDSEVEIWGSGRPRREFLHVQDLAKACLFILSKDQKEMSNIYNEKIFFQNIGSGYDISIKDVAECIKDVVGFNGQLSFNTSMPDGTPKKLLDISRVSSLGWKQTISFEDGINETYKWFVENFESLRI